MPWVVVDVCPAQYWSMGVTSALTQPPLEQFWPLVSVEVANFCSQVGWLVHRVAVLEVLVSHTSHAVGLVQSHEWWLNRDRVALETMASLIGAMLHET